LHLYKQLTILPNQADALAPREVVGNLIELILGTAVVGAGQLIEDDGGRSGHPCSADVSGRGHSGREEPDSTVCVLLLDYNGSVHRE